MTQAFLAAVQGGSLQDLLVHLSPDVVLITDGGGLKKAALRPIQGVDNVLRFGLGVLTKPGMPTQWRAVEVNGLPGIAGLFEDGTLDSVTTFDLDGPLVRELYMVRNPEKLQQLL